MIKKLLFFFPALVLLGCTSEKHPSNTFFAGQIINPTDSIVVLFKGEEPVDTARLDIHNRFSMSLKKIKSGLYNFSHLPEYQYVFIESGDSIFVRLNTLDFDESIVFMGRGSEINNFLIDMFLTFEEEESQVSSFYALEPIPFKYKTDSLYQLKRSELQNLITSSNLSPEAIEIANASIDFNYFSTQEIYPYAHRRRTGSETLDVLPNDFYAYRDHINFDNPRLSHYRPYYNYVVMLVNNLSYNDCLGGCQNETQETSRHYHFHKLSLIDSLAKEKQLRDNMFRNAAYAYVFDKNNSNKDYQEYFKTFHSYSKNNKHHEEIQQLFNQVIALQPGKQLPKIAIVDNNNLTTSFTKVLDAPVNVFYFWSINQKNHMNNINNRIAQLKQMYPNTHFIGININEKQDEWLYAIADTRMMLNSSQYRCAESKDMMRQLAFSNNLNKAIIADNNGMIINAFEGIFSKSLENTLAEYARK